MRFDWRIASGRLELRVSCLSVQELEVVIVLRDGDIERRVVVTDASFTFTEADYPEVFTDEFDGSFQLFHRVPYGPLVGTESFSVQARERIPKALLEAIQQLRGCGADDCYMRCSNKRGWQDWNYGWGKRARWHDWNDGTESYLWRDQEQFKRRGKACLFHDPREGKWCRNNRCCDKQRVLEIHIHSKLLMRDRFIR